MKKTKTKKVSTVQRGNYYKQRTKKHYEKLGYTVQLTEFSCATFFQGRCIYRKIDIFGSDGIAMNGSEIIFWNSKHTATDNNDSYNEQMRQAKKEFGSYPFPKSVKRHIVMWKPRQKPEVVDCTDM